MNSGRVVSTDGSYKILDVCVVEGCELMDYWKRQMQKIVTEDRDFYIDNLPDKKHGYFEHAHAFPGYDWSKHIGETVHKVNVIEHDGYLWLNKVPC